MGKQPAPLGLTERLNIILLVILYLLQGVPNGLVFSTIPFLMKDHMSYSQLGVLSLATYPYSLKLFWSPIVDAVFVPTIGRRKSWIIPIQLILGVLFLWLGGNIDHYMKPMGDGWDTTYTLTSIFLVMVLLSATQDIAVDGWALTLLPEEHLSYASTAQTIGLNTGFFLSFTVYLAFGSAEFCNTYFRSVAADVGMLTLTDYLYFWAAAYFLVTAYLIFFKNEGAMTENEEMGIGESYQVLWKICKLPQMSQYIILLLIAKLGFVATDAVTSLKLIDKGLRREDLALAALLDFPSQLFFGYMAARWSNGARPLSPWVNAYYIRLLSVVASVLLVYAIPESGPNSHHLGAALAVTLFSSFASTTQFVSMGVFMNNIADPAVGGTYMTLLNTLSNLGGTWPRYFVLKAVDWFTYSGCSVHDALDSSIQCTTEIGKQECQKLGGSCTIVQDGFYVMSVASFIIGILLMVLYIHRVARHIESIPPTRWRIIKVAKD